MTTIYRISTYSDDYMYFAMDDYEILSKMGEDFDTFALGNKSLADIWKTPDATFLLSDTGAISLPDISSWANCLIFNQKAYDILADKLQAVGEALPVNVSGVTYYFFNVTTPIDDKYIDLDKSEKAYFEGMDAGIDNLEFKNEDIDDSILMFTTSYDGYSNIFCTEAFKSLIEKSGLTGVTFNTKLSIDLLKD